MCSRPHSLLVPLQLHPCRVRSPQHQLQQFYHLSHARRLCIASATANASRRHAIRKSWFQWLSDSDSPVPPPQRQAIEVVFVGSHTEQEALSAEMAQYRDILLVNAPEGYQHLWRKALTFMHGLKRWYGGDMAAFPDSGWRPRHLHTPHFVMHADDDSYIRIDHLLARMASWPHSRFYWGYIWDGTGNRCTAPIRNPRNKSYMPEEQYSLDYYPPFASGCGFVLSWDLVDTLATAAPNLPDYRLLDPPFGIHLCGPPDRCLVDPPIVPVHDECVRPYRPLPTYRSDTVVQHYLRPEEFGPFHRQALQGIRCEEVSGDKTDDRTCPDQAPELAGGSAAAEHLYSQLVSMGIWRR